MLKKISTQNTYQSREEFNLVVISGQLNQDYYQRQIKPYIDSVAREKFDSENINIKYFETPEQAQGFISKVGASLILMQDTNYLLDQDNDKVSNPTNGFLLSKMYPDIPFIINTNRKYKKREYDAINNAGISSENIIGYTWLSDELKFQTGGDLRTSFEQAKNSKVVKASPSSKKVALSNFEGEDWRIVKAFMINEERFIDLGLTDNSNIKQIYSSNLELKDFKLENSEMVYKLVPIQEIQEAKNFLIRVGLDPEQLSKKFSQNINKPKAGDVPPSIENFDFIQEHEIPARLYLGIKNFDPENPQNVIDEYNRLRAEGDRLANQFLNKYPNNVNPFEDLVSEKDISQKLAEILNNAVTAEDNYLKTLLFVSAAKFQHSTVNNSNLEKANAEYTKLDTRILEIFKKLGESLEKSNISLDDLIKSSPDLLKYDSYIRNTSKLVNISATDNLFAPNAKYDEVLNRGDFAKLQQAARNRRSPDAEVRSQGAQDFANIFADKSEQYSRIYLEFINEKLDEAKKAGFENYEDVVLAKWGDELTKQDKLYLMSELGAETAFPTINQEFFANRSALFGIDQVNYSDYYLSPAMDAASSTTFTLDEAKNILLDSFRDIGYTENMLNVASEFLNNNIDYGSSGRAKSGSVLIPGFIGQDGEKYQAFSSLRMDTESISLEGLILMAHEVMGHMIESEFKTSTYPSLRGDLTLKTEELMSLLAEKSLIKTLLQRDDIKGTEKLALTYQLTFRSSLSLSSPIAFQKVQEEAFNFVEKQRQKGIDTNTEEFRKEFSTHINKEYLEASKIIFGKDVQFPENYEHTWALNKQMFTKPLTYIKYAASDAAGFLLLDELEKLETLQQRQEFFAKVTNALPNYRYEDFMREVFGEDVDISMKNIVDGSLNNNREMVKEFTKLNNIAIVAREAGRQKVKQLMEIAGDEISFAKFRLNNEQPGKEGLDLKLVLYKNKNSVPLQGKNTQSFTGKFAQLKAEQFELGCIEALESKNIKIQDSKKLNKIQDFMASAIEHDSKLLQKFIDSREAFKERYSPLFVNHDVLSHLKTDKEIEKYLSSHPEMRDRLEKAAREYFVIALNEALIMKSGVERSRSRFNMPLHDVFSLDQINNLRSKIIHDLEYDQLNDLDIDQFYEYLSQDGTIDRLRDLISSSGFMRDENKALNLLNDIEKYIDGKYLPNLAKYGMAGEIVRDFTNFGKISNLSSDNRSKIKSGNPVNELYLEMGDIRNNFAHFFRNFRGYVSGIIDEELEVGINRYYQNSIIDDSEGLNSLITSPFTLGDYSDKVNRLAKSKNFDDFISGLENLQKYDLQSKSAILLFFLKNPESLDQVDLNKFFPIMESLSVYNDPLFTHQYLMENYSQNNDFRNLSNIEDPTWQVIQKMLDKTDPAISSNIDTNLNRLNSSSFRRLHSVYESSLLAGLFNNVLRQENLDQNEINKATKVLEKTLSHLFRNYIINDARIYINAFARDYPYGTTIDPKHLFDERSIEISEASKQFLTVAINIFRDKSQDKLGNPKFQTFDNPGILRTLEVFKRDLQYAHPELYEKYKNNFDRVISESYKGDIDPKTNKNNISGQENAVDDDLRLKIIDFSLSDPRKQAFDKLSISTSYQPIDPSVYIYLDPNSDNPLSIETSYLRSRKRQDFVGSLNMSESGFYAAISYSRENAEYQPFEDEDLNDFLENKRQDFEDQVSDFLSGLHEELLKESSRLQKQKDDYLKLSNDPKEVNNNNVLQSNNYLYQLDNAITRNKSQISKVEELQSQDLEALSKQIAQKYYNNFEKISKGSEAFRQYQEALYNIKEYFERTSFEDFDVNYIYKIQKQLDEKYNFPSSQELYNLTLVDGEISRSLKPIELAKTDDVRAEAIIKAKHALSESIEQIQKAYTNYLKNNGSLATSLEINPYYFNKIDERISVLQDYKVLLNNSSNSAQIIEFVEGLDEGNKEYISKLTYYNQDSNGQISYDVNRILAEIDARLFTQEYEVQIDNNNPSKTETIKGLIAVRDELINKEYQRIGKTERDVTRQEVKRQLLNNAPTNATESIIHNFVRYLPAEIISYINNNNDSVNLNIQDLGFVSIEYDDNGNPRYFSSQKSIGMFSHWDNSIYSDTAYETLAHEFLHGMFRSAGEVAGNMSIGKYEPKSSISSNSEWENLIFSTSKKIKNNSNVDAQNNFEKLLNELENLNYSNVDIPEEVAVRISTEHLLNMMSMSEQQSRQKIAEKYGDQVSDILFKNIYDPAMAISANKNLLGIASVMRNPDINSTPAELQKNKINEIIIEIMQDSKLRTATQFDIPTSEAIESYNKAYGKTNFASLTAEQYVFGYLKTKGIIINSSFGGGFIFDMERLTTSEIAGILDLPRIANAANINFDRYRNSTTSSNRFNPENNRIDYSLTIVHSAGDSEKTHHNDLHNPIKKVSLTPEQYRAYENLKRNSFYDSIDPNIYFYLSPEIDQNSGLISYKIIASNDKNLAFSESGKFLFSGAIDMSKYGFAAALDANNFGSEDAKEYSQKFNQQIAELFANQKSILLDSIKAEEEKLKERFNEIKESGRQLDSSFIEDNNRYRSALIAQKSLIETYDKIIDNPQALAMKAIDKFNYKINTINSDLDNFNKHREDLYGVLDQIRDSKESELDIAEIRRILDSNIANLYGLVLLEQIPYDVIANLKDAKDNLEKIYKTGDLTSKTQFREQLLQNIKEVLDNDLLNPRNKDNLVTVLNLLQESPENKIDVEFVENTLKSVILELYGLRAINEAKLETIEGLKTSLLALDKFEKPSINGAKNQLINSVIEAIDNIDEITENYLKLNDALAIDLNFSPQYFSQINNRINYLNSYGEFLGKNPNPTDLQITNYIANLPDQQKQYISSITNYEDTKLGRSYDIPSTIKQISSLLKSEKFIVTDENGKEIKVKGLVGLQSHLIEEACKQRGVKREDISAAELIRELVYQEPKNGKDLILYNLVTSLPDELLSPLSNLDGLELNLKKSGISAVDVNKDGEFVYYTDRHSEGAYNSGSMQLYSDAQLPNLAHELTHAIFEKAAKVVTAVDQDRLHGARSISDDKQWIELTKDIYTSIDPNRDEPLSESEKLLVEIKKSYPQELFAEELAVRLATEYIIKINEFKSQGKRNPEYLANNFLVDSYGEQLAAKFFDRVYNPAIQATSNREVMDLVNLFSNNNQDLARGDKTKNQLSNLLIELIKTNGESYNNFLKKHQTPEKFIIQDNKLDYSKLTSSQFLYNTLINSNIVIPSSNDPKNGYILNLNTLGSSPIIEFLDIKRIKQETNLDLGLYVKKDQNKAPKANSDVGKLQYFIQLGSKQANFAPDLPINKLSLDNSRSQVDSEIDYRNRARYEEFRADYSQAPSSTSNRLANMDAGSVAGGYGTPLGVVGYKGATKMNEVLLTKTDAKALNTLMTGDLGLMALETANDLTGYSKTIAKLGPAFMALGLGFIATEASYKTDYPDEQAGVILGGIGAISGGMGTAAALPTIAQIIPATANPLIAGAIVFGGGYAGSVALDKLGRPTLSATLEERYLNNNTALSDYYKNLLEKNGINLSDDNYVKIQLENEEYFVTQAIYNQLKNKEGDFEQNFRDYLDSQKESISQFELAGKVFEKVVSNLSGEKSSVAQEVSFLSSYIRGGFADKQVTIKLPDSEKAYNKPFKELTLAEQNEILDYYKGHLKKLVNDGSVFEKILQDLQESDEYENLDIYTVKKMFYGVIDQYEFTVQAMEKWPPLDDKLKTSRENLKKWQEIYNIYNQGVYLANGSDPLLTAYDRVKYFEEQVKTYETLQDLRENYLPNSKAILEALKQLALVDELYDSSQKANVEYSLEAILAEAENGYKGDISYFTLSTSENLRSITEADLKNFFASPQTSVLPLGEVSPWKYDLHEYYGLIDNINADQLITSLLNAGEISNRNSLDSDWPNYQEVQRKVSQGEYNFAPQHLNPNIGAGSPFYNLNSKPTLQLIPYYDENGNEVGLYINLESRKVPSAKRGVSADTQGSGFNKLEKVDEGEIESGQYLNFTRAVAVNGLTINELLNQERFRELKENYYIQIGSNISPSLNLESPEILTLQSLVSSLDKDNPENNASILANFFEILNDRKALEKAISSQQGLNEVTKLIYQLSAVEVKTDDPAIILQLQELGFVDSEIKPEDIIERYGALAISGRDIIKNWRELCSKCPIIYNNNPENDIYEVIRESIKLASEAENSGGDTEKTQHLNTIRLLLGYYPYQDESENLARYFFGFKDEANTQAADLIIQNLLKENNIPENKEFSAEESFSIGQHDRYIITSYLLSRCCNKDGQLISSIPEQFEEYSKAFQHLIDANDIIQAFKEEKKDSELIPIFDSLMPKLFTMRYVMEAMRENNSNNNSQQGNNTLSIEEMMQFLRNKEEARNLSNTTTLLNSLNSQEIKSLNPNSTKQLLAQAVNDQQNELEKRTALAEQYNIILDSLNDKNNLFEDLPVLLNNLNSIRDLEEKLFISNPYRLSESQQNALTEYYSELKDSVDSEDRNKTIVEVVNEIKMLEKILNIPEDQKVGISQNLKNYIAKREILEDIREFRSLLNDNDPTNDPTKQDFEQLQQRFENLDDDKENATPSVDQQSADLTFRLKHATPKNLSMVKNTDFEEALKELGSKISNRDEKPDSTNKASGDINFFKGKDTGRAN